MTDCIQHTSCRRSMKFAVVLYLCLGVVLSRRHRGNSCNSLIANLERDRDRVVERCSFDVNCGPPKDLENAVVSYTSTYLDSVATYSCKEGFSFIGYTQDVVCGVFNWSDILGTCVPVCPEAPPVACAVAETVSTIPSEAAATYRLYSITHKPPRVSHRGGQPLQ